MNRAVRHLRQEMGYSDVDDYFKHLGLAIKLAWCCFKGVLKTLLHGLYPGWFENPLDEVEERLI